MPGPRGLDLPSIKESVAEIEDDEMNEVLSAAEATEFRALAAGANYLRLIGRISGMRSKSCAGRWRHRSGAARRSSRGWSATCLNSRL